MESNKIVFDQRSWYQEMISATMTLNLWSVNSKFPLMWDISTTDLYRFHKLQASVLNDMPSRKFRWFFANESTSIMLNYALGTKFKKKAKQIYV